MCQGIFLKRPNRFIAYVNINGKDEVVHVKNTGRCKELLQDNARVICQKSDNPNRKTQYDLISVYKGDRLINMDSQAPNKVFKEFLEQGKFRENLTYIKPEYKYGNSRIDFYCEDSENNRYLIEVKGVTLEKNNVVLFPDAPTERGVKHIQELIKARKEENIKTVIAFVIQMDKVDYFTPNRETHPEFADVLLRAEKAGVEILCLTCQVEENSLEIKSSVPYEL